jgi:2,4-dienoyl-CoA reductase-like NADH-dependent reductase (Old Yellow Enzyme family)
MGICFSSSLTDANHRTDEYGGSIENKARIFEVLDAIKEVIPEEKWSSF